MFDTDQEVTLSPGLSLQVLRGCGYTKNVSLRRYTDHVWISRKFRVSSMMFEKPDVIVSCMPCHHLSYEAVRYAKLHRIPIVIDVRDLWPDIFLSGVRQPVVKALGRLALHHDFSRLRYLLKEADSVVAVSQGYLDWALHRAGKQAGPLDKVYYLGYQRRKAAPYHGSRLPDGLRDLRNRPTLLFIGTFGLSYDLRLLLEVARDPKLAEMTGIRFILAGTGQQEVVLRQEARDLNNVVFTGWLGGQEIMELMRCGQAGILPYVPDAPQGIPNKCFEYLAAGLPLISSLQGEMSNLIEKHKLGLNYRPGDRESLSAVLRRFFADGPLRDELTKNASLFFDRYGSADSIYAGYAQHIENLVSAKGR